MPSASPAMADQQDSAYRAIFDASSDGLVINDAETGFVLEANPAFCQMHGYDSMVGLHPTTFIHADSHGLFTEYLRVVGERREFRTRAKDVRRDGSVFDVEVLGRGFTYQGRFALLGVVRDVTEQVRAYDALEERVQERTREVDRRRQVAEALRDLIATINSTRSLDEILSQALAQASRLLGSDAAAIYVPTSSLNDPVLRVAAATGLSLDYATLTPAVGAPVSGLAFTARRPVAVYDVRAALTVDEQEAAAAPLDDRGSHLRATRVWCGHDSPPDRPATSPFDGHSAVLAVPLSANNVTYGCLTLLYRQPRDLTHDEVWLATAFADQAALAVQNAAVHEQSEQRRRELEGLYRADQALHRSLRLHDVLEALVDQATDLLQVDAVAIWGADPQVPGAGIPLATRNLSADYLDEAVRLNVSDPAVRQVWWTSSIVVADDIRGDDRFPAALRLALEREGYRAIMATLIKVGDQVFGNFSVGLRNPHVFSRSQQRMLTALASRAAIAIQNARLHEESEERRRELEALYEADRLLHRSLRQSDVLQALVDTACSVLMADKSSVLIWNEDRTYLMPGATRGFGAESVAQMTHAPGEGVTTVVALTGQPVIVPDATSDPRVAHRITAPEGIRSLMHVPVRAGNEIFGVFGVNYCTLHQFSTKEQRLLEALADRAGLAIQNARLYEQAQHAATLEERQRLARELHDAVTQTLFSASLIAEVAPRLWQRDPEQARQRLEELRTLTRGALAEMRALLLELRPAALLEVSLDQLLSQLAAATRSRSGLVVDVSASSVGPLPAEVQVALYRIAQEALNNVVKHARATHAQLLTRTDSRGIELVVADDGRGFQPDRVEAGHLGLGIMRERAEAIGASLDYTSRPGEGTRIQIRWQP